MSVLASRKTFLERTELDMGSSFFAEAETREVIFRHRPFSVSEKDGINLSAMRITDSEGTRLMKLVSDGSKAIGFDTWGTCTSM